MHLNTRNILCVLSSIAIADAALAANSADARAYQDRRDFADGLFSRGLYKQAGVEYSRLLKDYSGHIPDLASMAFRLGEAYRHSGNFNSAIKAYKVSADQGDSQFTNKALFKRASLFLQLGQLDTSNELFESLLGANLEPEIRELCLYYHGATLESLKRYPDAVARWETLLKEFPTGAMGDQARLALGRVYAIPGECSNINRSKELLVALSKSSNDDRLAAEADFLLGSAAYAVNNYTEAAEYFQSLLEKHPTDMRVGVARLPAAWSLCKAGRYQVAIANCQAALESGTVVDAAVIVELRYVLAQSLFGLARFAEAAEAYQGIAAMSAQEATAFKNRAIYQAALCYHKIGDFQKACNLLQPVLSDKDLRSDALWLLAESAVAIEGGIDTAIESYKLLVAEFPDSPYTADALYRLGFQLRNRGAWNDAAQAHRSLAERFPRSELAPRARFSAASSLSASGQTAKALVEWQTLLRDYPTDATAPEAYFQEALDFIRIDRKTEALAALSDLLRLHPQTTRKAEACYWRGVLLQDAGNYPAAVEALRLCLNSNPSEATAGEARFSLATALQSAGQGAEAVALFADLLRDPAAAHFTPPQLAWLAERQYEQKNYTGAATTALRLTELAKGDVWLQTAWTIIGRSERAQGHMPEAEKAYRKAVDLPVVSTSAPEATLRLAELVLARGDAKEADKLFRMAVERCSDTGFEDMRIYAYNGLGQAALAAGDKDSAAKYFMTVCVLYHDAQIIPPIIRRTIPLLEELGRVDESESLRDILKNDYDLEP